MNLKEEKQKRNSLGVESRTFGAEFRVTEKKNGKKIIEGYSAVFDLWSEDLGWFREKIDRGAFTQALTKSDVRALFNHNSDLILGRESSGTLKLSQDERGLYMEVEPPNTTYANDLLESIRRGDVKEQSFGFTVEDDQWTYQKNGIDDRTIKAVKTLYDVSPVTFPAYTDTEVALRSHKHFLNSISRDGESLSKRAEIIQLQSKVSELLL